MAKTSQYWIAGALFATCVMAAACRSDAEEAPSVSRAPPSDGAGAHTLDLAHRVLVQPIGIELEQPQHQKFVQIEISEVLNPKQHTLIFEVSFRRPDGLEVPLAPFSPFPSDNPGTFIVATRGLLERGGAVVVTMVVPEGVSTSEPLRVQLKPVVFREQ